MIEVVIASPNWTTRVAKMLATRPLKVPRG
jgi:hypothetical protein